MLLVDFILVSGIVIILCVLFLLSKSKRELPHNLLVIYFSYLLLVVSHAYGQLNDIRLIFFLSIPFDVGARLFLPPLLFLYVKSIFTTNYRLLTKDILHFIPFVLSIIFVSIPVMIYHPNALIKLNYLSYLYKGEILPILEGIYFIGYLALSLQMYKRGKVKFKESYSNYQESDFTWILKMLVFALIVIFIDLSTGIYELAFGKLPWDIGFVTVVSIVPLITYLGYYGVGQSRILLPQFLYDGTEHPCTSIEKDEKRLKEIQGLDTELISTRLEELVCDKKIYTDETLSLSKLAAGLEISPKKLSLFLNHYYETSFYNYINGHRVDEVKRRLLSREYDHLTIIAIAFDCGFNSKTSFNRIFKKVTGISPSAFKKNSFEQQAIKLSKQSS